MQRGALHSWNLAPREAIALQKELAPQVDTHSSLPWSRVKLIAGADVSFSRFSKILHAGVVVLRADDLSVVERQAVKTEGSFPYVPGLLSFREVPPVLAAFARLMHKPDVLMLDGQGLAHPRRFGSACHIGLWLDIPTIGCAKSILVGEYGRLSPEAGSVAPLRHAGETVGLALRTKLDVKPVYVSCGHRINLVSAARIVLRCSAGYRLPEPTRQAHLLVNAVRRGEMPLA